VGHEHGYRHRAAPSGVLPEDHFLLVGSIRLPALPLCADLHAEILRIVEQISVDSNQTMASRKQMLHSLTWLKAVLRAALSISVSGSLQATE